MELFFEYCKCSKHWETCSQYTATATYESIFLFVFFFSRWAFSFRSSSCLEVTVDKLTNFKFGSPAGSLYFWGRGSRSFGENGGKRENRARHASICIVISSFSNFWYNSVGLPLSFFASNHFFENRQRVGGGVCKTSWRFFEVFWSLLFIPYSFRQPKQVSSDDHIAVTYPPMCCK